MALQSRMERALTLAPKKPAPKANRYRVDAVDRALVLLDALASTPGANASQLAAQLGANRSLVFRLLSTLVGRGFAIKDEHNRYRLGPRVYYLGQQSEANAALVDFTADVLDRLLAETEENVYLIVRNGVAVRCIAARISPQPIRLAPDVGTTGEIYTGLVSRMLLAYAPTDVQDDVLSNHLAEFAPAGLRGRAKVEALLARIRADGFYEAPSEDIAEIFVQSAPVRDSTGQVRALVALAAPLSRMAPRRRAETLRRVIAAAGDMSRRLGHQPGGRIRAA